MRFAKITFFAAGVYGLAVLVPLFFLEGWTSRHQPPAITHPEYYYGFVGVTVAWQVLFLMLSRDPIRYRPLMLPAILEKAVFVIAVFGLYLSHRVAASILAPTTLDAIWCILFITSYLKTANAPNASV